MKRTLTRNITVRGLKNGASNTRPNTGEPFTEIWWNPLQISSDPAAARYNTTTTTELAHEFCHVASGLRGGPQNERNVCAFENFIRFEQGTVIRQEYVDGTWVANKNLVLIHDDPSYRPRVG